MILLNGQVLKDYRVVRLLGRGGFAEVYEAEHFTLKTRVALKLLTVSGSGSRMQKHHEQFLLEARTLAALNHPNLARVHDYFVAAEGHVIVLDLVPGTTLGQALEAWHGGFEWPRVRGWAGQILDALEYLHGQQPPIILRDLTPGNLMEHNGRIVLIDFGLVKHLEQGKRTGTVVRGTGTPGFAPIEQYGGLAGTDQRTDLYSFGAVLYCLLGGVAPPEALDLCRGRRALQDLHRINPTVPLEVDSLIKHCLAMEPEDRPASASEVKRLLAFATRGVLATAPGPCPSPAGAAVATNLLPRAQETRAVPAPLPPPQSAYCIRDVLSGIALTAAFLVAHAVILSHLFRVDGWDTHASLAGFLAAYGLLSLRYWQRADDGALRTLRRRSCIGVALILALDLFLLLR